MPISSGNVLLILTSTYHIILPQPMLGGCGAQGVKGGLKSVLCTMLYTLRLIEGTLLSVSDCVYFLPTLKYTCVFMLMN